MQKRSKLTLLFLALTASGALGLVWFLQRGDRGASADNSRRFRRTTPMTGTSLYVDEAICADCHATQTNGLKQTGHADTFRTSLESKAARRLDGRTFYDPERKYSYHYHFDEQKGLSVSIPERFGEDRFMLTYELGSGHNAVTFLTLVPNQFGDTVGIEHRVSLYADGGQQDLDLTPSHAAAVPMHQIEHFGKVIQGDKLTRCVNCHTTTAEIVRQEIMGLRPNVGCQNCHGPGREHVMAIEDGRQGDYAGFMKQSALAEIQMCGRCHRLPGADPEVHVAPDNIHIVRFQSVGLLESRCFKGSRETLKCSTCHDPHQPVSREPQHYMARCVACHDGQKSDRCPVSPQTNCIACHMPAVDVHRGIQFHDHWIRVRPDSQPKAAPEAAEKKHHPGAT